MRLLLEFKEEKAAAILRFIGSHQGEITVLSIDEGADEREASEENSFDEATKKMLDERLAEYRANPDDVLDAKAVIAKLKAELE